MNNKHYILILIFLLTLPFQNFGQTKQSNDRKPLPLFSTIKINRSIRQFEKAVDYYNAGRYYSALEIFRRLIKVPAIKNPKLTAGYLLTMKCYLQIGKYTEAKETGRNFLNKFPNSKYLDDVLVTFGDTFVSEGRYRSALESYLKARLLTKEDQLKDKIDRKLLKMSDGFLTRSDIDDLLSLEMDPTNRTILTLMKAGTILSKGNQDLAALTLFRMESKLLPELFSGTYDDLRIKTYKKTEGSVIVGVVLPLSGFYESRGNSFLLGLRQAISEVQKRRSLNIVLEVFDNEGNDLRTIECLEKLSNNPNVISVIGPLSAFNSTVAATSIKNSDLTLLIPISTQTGLSELGESIFQLNVDLEKRGEYAADYIVSELGLETIAVLAPADRLGKGLVDGFVMKADELGADIIDIQWYSGLPVDLKSQFLALRKVAFERETIMKKIKVIDLDFDTLDQTFIISVSDFFPEEVKEELSPSDSNKIVLSSIQAIYMPIHPGDINYVGSQFSSYNLDTKLFGNVNWYDLTELSQEMIGPNLKDMTLFTDFVYNDSLSAFIEEIIHPDDIKMALYGYDIMLFLASKLSNETTRQKLLASFNENATYRGASKLFSFTDNYPRSNTALHILRFDGSRLTKVNEIIADTLFTRTKQTP